MAWMAGRALSRRGLPLPDSVPFEGEGYWIRRGYYDLTDH